MKNWRASIVVGLLLLLSSVAWTSQKNDRLLWPSIGLLIGGVALAGLLMAHKRGASERVRRIKVSLVFLFLAVYLFYTLYKPIIGVNVGFLALILLTLIVLEIRTRKAIMWNEVT